VNVEWCQKEAQALGHIKVLPWAVWPSTKPHAGGSPLVGCPQLLVQYTRS